MSDSCNDSVRPQHAIEFEFDDFCDHLELAMAAGSSLIPTPDPEQTRLILLEENGRQMQLRFTDCPMNRAMFAVKRSFRDALPFCHLSAFRLSH